MGDERRFVLGLAFAGLLLTLAACGGAPTTETDSASAELTTDPTPSELGFVPPTFVLDIPDSANLPGIPSLPPSIASVTVKQGLDGRTPDETIELVKSKIGNPIAAQNSSFVSTTIKTTQKFFTIAVNNIFVTGSPPSKFVNGLGDAKITVLGTMSSVHPTVLRVETAGAPPQHFVWEQGTYAPFPNMRYPVIMECKIRLAPQGVMLHYPSWSAPVLSGPTGTITEGP